MVSYDLPLEVMGRALKGRYRGQTQKWFAFRFNGDEAEINVHAPGGGGTGPNSGIGAGTGSKPSGHDRALQARRL